MAKLKEYYQVGNREEMTQESLLVLIEDIYKDLALAINSNTSDSGELSASGRLNNTSGGFYGTPFNISSNAHTTTGRCVCTFTNPMANANYALVATPSLTSGFKYFVTILAQSTTGFTLQVFDEGGNFRNVHSVNVIVVGDIT